MKKVAWIIALASLGFATNVMATETAAKAAAPHEGATPAKEAKGVDGISKERQGAHMKDGEKGGKGGKAKAGSHTQAKAGKDKIAAHGHMKDGEKGGKGGKDKTHMAPAGDATAPAAGAHDGSQMGR